MHSPNVVNSLRILIAIAAIISIGAACSNNESGQADSQPHEHESDPSHSSEEDHDHEGGVPNPEKSGPNGGRLIASTDPNVEFLLLDDRRVQIVAVDSERQPTPVGDLVVSLIGGDRANPTELAFSKVDDKLLSTEPVPEGANLPITLSVAAAPDAEAKTEKFYLNMNTCPTCDRHEYACICDH